MRSVPPFLLVLLLGSGCAALIYEIVWFQLLELVIGSSAVSLGVLVGTYMGGMGLGSVLLPRVVWAARRPLLVFGLLEAGIGLLGISILFGMPEAARFYALHSGGGLAGVLTRGLFAAVCLLPPTVLMGATLPAIARQVTSAPDGVSWLGFLYGGNIAGAVFGCLFAGFYLLRVHDSVFATFVAAALNGMVALTAIALSFSRRFEIQSDSRRREPGVPLVAENFPWPVYVAIALSGLSAIGAEVIWTRLLSLTLGGTVYAFSIILAVFLSGLGLGSGVGSALARESRRPGILLGWCQFFLMVAICWTAHRLAYSLPYDLLPTEDSWSNFLTDLERSFWALLPATLLWGASFPLALAAAARGQDPARLVGGVYAANTMGGILGSLSFSILFIPWLGTQQSQRWLIVFAACAALLIFAAYAWRFWCRISPAGIVCALSMFGVVGLSTFVLVKHVAKTPAKLIAFGRYIALYPDTMQILYVGEGMNSSVAVTRTSTTGDLNFHISGRVEASTEPRDMRIERMLGQIPALLHPHPASVLVVGCGAGVTAGSFTIQPGVEKITICEMEPLVPPIAAKFFKAQNFGVVDDPRTQIIFDDARHYLFTTRDRFDIITSDPIHPRIKGSATLYTKEYFELEKNHLNPGGLVTHWVPLYETDSDVVKSEMATFFEVFPEGTVWTNEREGKGYDLVLLGPLGETKIDLDDLAERLEQPAYASVARSLQAVGFSSVSDLLATYVGNARDLAPWLKGATINRDRSLRLQYMAGFHAEGDHRAAIFDEIVAYRRFPARLFTGSDADLKLLQDAMAKTGWK